MERVDEHVVRMGTEIVNWYLVAGEDGVTVVDAGLPTYSRQLGEGLRELQRPLSDVKAIVLTHAHADHVGFAEKLRRRLGIPVYVHRDDEELATSSKAFGSYDGSPLPYARYPHFYRLFFELARTGALIPRPIAEVRRFDDGDELPVPGRLRVIHTPGHTAGHCSFVTGEVLIAGDALVTVNPATGAPGPQIPPRPFNHDTEQALASLERLVGTGATILAPGHGAPAREPNGAVEAAKRRGAT